MGGRGRGRGRGRRHDDQQNQGVPGTSHQPGLQNSAPAGPAQRRLEQQMQQMRLGSTSQPIQCADVGAGQANPRAVRDCAGPSQPRAEGAAGPVSRGSGPSQPRAEGAAGPVGRGSMRGGRVIDYQFVRTKPDHISTKQGNLGSPCSVTANYFKIKTLPNWSLQQYRVDIAPEEDRTHERRNLLRAHREMIGFYIFDGTVLYTANRLTVSLGESITLTSQSEDGTIYTLTVRHVNEVQFGDYAYQQVFNLLLRSCIRALGLQLVGRDYYDANESVKIRIPQYGIELWPGYKTSIRQHEAGIFMCVEITHKVMRMDTVNDLLRSLANSNPGNWRNDFARRIIGCIVLTQYNNKTYRITDVEFEETPASVFERNGEKITFAEYMKQKYQIVIRDMRQPLLTSKARGRDIRAGSQDLIRLIPEVCHCTGIDDQMRGDWRTMAALTQHTRINPAERVNRLLAFNRRLQSNQQAVAELTRFNMTMDNKLVEIPGRIFGNESILMGPNNKQTTILTENVDWTRNLRSNPLLSPKHLSHWCVIVPRRERQNLINFIQLLQKTGRSMGITVQQPQLSELAKDMPTPSDYAQALTDVLNSGQPELVMVIVPGSNAKGNVARYEVIKKKCCVERAVPSQVLLAKNLNDPKRVASIATKVMVQINCKIGGAPWTMPSWQNGLMVVGFDVCHDTNNKSSSYGAMVASLDIRLTRYFSAVTPHNRGEELSNNLATHIVSAARKYNDVNGDPPSKIIIYRDGVGEGQIQYVHETELSTIKEKLEDLYKSINKAPPRMAFIIVTKRINTRVFYNMGNVITNPAPGTIVDDVITDPEKFDFFLVSQSVREGTVTPTSYNVIHDTSGANPGQLQRLTYKLCHMYYNWSGTVRVPAVCQYAHKLAFLVGQTLHKQPHAQLADLLYFL